VNLVAVIGRLRADAPAFSNRVAGAGELDQALDDRSTSFAFPAAYVVPAGEEAESDQVVERFGVVVAVDATADERGQAPLETLDTIRDELLLALRWWTPDVDHEPVTFDGAGVLGLNQNALYYRFDFSTIRHLGGLITYTITAEVMVSTASTPAAVIAELATAIETATSAVRLDSDYIEQGPVVLPGDLRYQLQALAASEALDSNYRYPLISCVLRVHRRLLTTETERSYTEGAMQTHVASLLDQSLWQTAGVREVTRLPELEFPTDVTRT
jgi:hypothetical protein